MSKNKPPKRNFFKDLGFALVVFCLIALLLNGLLSFIGLDKYDKEFLPRTSYPIFVPGEGSLAQYYVTNSHFLNAINKQKFKIKKPAGLTRIFVVGGSAAFAWPYTEEYGFSGHLRRALDSFAPGKFEVVNATGMSFGSHRVYDVLQDVVEFDPDLVIVYSGNNEYVERNVISKLKRKDGTLQWLGTALSQTNLYRAVRIGLFRVVPSVFHEETGPDLTDLRADRIISRGALGRSPEIDQEVLSNYRTNISAIRDTLLENKTKMIFCTTPSNVVGYHPSYPPLRFAREEDAVLWKKLQQEVLDITNIHDSTSDHPEKDSLLRQSEQLLTQMLQIDANNPWTLYTMGLVHLWLGENERSYVEFVRAKDLDARPIRALSSFNAAVRAIVGERAGNEDVMLFDLEEVMADEIKRGGADWLYLDYCHFTYAGHKLVAINMLAAIQQFLGTNFDLNKMSFSIFNDPWGKNITVTVKNNVLFASGSTHIHNGQYEAAEKDFKEILQAYEPNAVGIYPSSVYRALSYLYEAQGKEELQKIWLLKAIAANPDNFEALISGGLLFLDEGNLEKAEELLKKSLVLNRYAPMTFEGLGRLALIKGEAQEAVSHFEGALRLGADNFLLRKNLGMAYLALDNVEQAILAWQAALAYDSSDTETKDLLKKYSK